MARRHSTLRWFLITVAVASLAILSAAQIWAATTYTVYNARTHLTGGSRIVKITPNNRYALVVGSNDDPGDRRLRAILISTNDFVRVVIDLNAEPALTGLGLVNPVVSSVAIHPTGGYAIVTIQESDSATIAAGDEKAGGAIFITIDQAAGTMAVARATPLRLGIHPESIEIAPNGQYAVVANRDLGAGSAIAPVRAGTISVIDLRSTPGAAKVTDTITPAVPSGPGIYTRHAADPGPESVAISPDNTRAFVTLQENNAVTIIDVAPSNLDTHATTVALPQKPGTTTRLLPDGLAAFLGADGRQYIVTANEGLFGERAESISLFGVGVTPSLTLLADSGSAIVTAVTAANLPKGPDGTSQPEMVAVGQVGGTLKAFVTLEQSDAVVVFTLDPLGVNKLRYDTVVPLNRVGQPPAYGPEGVAIAHISDQLDYIVTANAGRSGFASQNISVIEARSSASVPERHDVWLPLVFK